MGLQEAAQRFDLRHDGFGTRWFEHDRQWGRVEVLDLVPALSTTEAERAIRARAKWLSECDAAPIARVHRIERKGRTLSVVSEAPDGVTLSDLLAALEFGSITLSDAAILELAAATVRAVGWMHEMSGTLAHGALSPAHILLRPRAGVVLTGALFGDSLQALQRNREQLWREFELALPQSASLPRFDQRADLTQLGALTLAIFLRRTLRGGEYPREIIALVRAATADVAPSSCGSALQMWLHQALLLHPKAMFGSAAAAARAFDEVGADVSGRRAGAQALRDAIRRLGGEPVPAPRTAPASAARRADIARPRELVTSAEA